MYLKSIGLQIIFSSNSLCKGTKKKNLPEIHKQCNWNLRPSCKRILLYPMNNVMWQPV